jgi:DNA-binding beta-propeller fold protein YncE
MTPMIVGTGKYQYRVADNWGRGPQGRDPGGNTAHIALDSQGRVYVSRYNEGTRAILVYDRDGRFIRSFGEGVLTEAHYIGIDKNDQVYCADPGDHTVKVFSAEGELMMTLGTPGQVGGPGEPFNKPAKAVVSPAGDIFVADGYGQNRVHRFSADGRLLLSWGAPGAGPGQFNVPHGIALDPRGQVLVSDRLNNRIQVFDAAGGLLSIWESGFSTPHDLCVGKGGEVYVIDGEVTAGRFSVLSSDGQLLARWTVKDTDGGPVSNWLHGICEDPDGNLYATDKTCVQKLIRL